MKIFSRFLGTLALCLASAGLVQAGELFSPPLAATSITGDNFGECVVTNISDTTRDVLIQGFNSEGVEVMNFLYEIAPNHTRGLSLSEGNATGPVIFCKFSFKGNTSNFRAAIHVLDGGGDGIIAALEAH